MRTVTAALATLLVVAATGAVAAAPDNAARCRLTATLPLQFVGATTLSVCKTAYANADANTEDKAEFAWLVGRAFWATGKNRDGASWVRKAADLGSAPAAAAYASALDKGDHGVAADPAAFREYLHRAADLGDAQAQYVLASHFFAEEQMAEAVRYATAAAEQDHAEASFFVGNVYYAGVGVAKDLDVALSWYRKASALGSSTAAYMAGSILSNTMRNDEDRELVLSFFYRANLLGESLENFVEMIDSAVDENQAWAKHLRGIRLLMANPPDHAGGLRLLAQSAAAEGNSPAYRADALYNLAVAASRGLERPKDIGEAIRRYEGAADFGSVPAMLALGNLYLLGTDVPKDLKRAAEWYSKAMSTGDAEAGTRLAVLYATGDFPFDEAVRAADAGGNARFAYAVALRLESGNGVGQDAARARTYFERAAERGLAPALLRLAQYDDLSAATRLDYLTRAAELGYSPAQASLATHYRDIDPQQWEHWLYKAAASGNVDAQVDIGRRLMRGDGVQKDGLLASKYILDASKSGSVRALDALASLYLTGEGTVGQSQEKAVAIMQQLADRGEAWALMQIGHIYANGFGGKPRNERVAMQWYQKAKDAKVGDVADQYMAEIRGGDSAYANGERIAQFVGVVGGAVIALGALGEALGGGADYSYTPPSNSTTNHNCNAAMEAYAWSGIDGGRIGMWC